MECHLKHWDVHKKSCYSVGEREVSYKLLGDESSDLFDTCAYGIIGPGCVLPPGVPKTFLFKMRAWKILCRSHSARLIAANACVFTELYEAISHDKATWLRFLAHPEHSSHAENIAFILLALVSVHRAKNDLPATENVLFMCYEIITKIRPDDTRYTMGHYYELEFYALCECKKDYNMCVHSYRKICLFELHRDKSTNKCGEFCLFLGAVLKKKPTRNLVENASDEALFGVVQDHRSQLYFTTK